MKGELLIKPLSTMVSSLIMRTLFSMLADKSEKIRNMELKKTLLLREKQYRIKTYGRKFSKPTYINFHAL